MPSFRKTKRFVRLVWHSFLVYFRDSRTSAGAYELVALVLRQLNVFDEVSSFQVLFHTYTDIFRLSAYYTFFGVDPFFVWLRSITLIVQDEWNEI